VSTWRHDMCVCLRVLQILKREQAAKLSIPKDNGRPGVCMVRAHVHTLALMHTDKSCSLLLLTFHPRCVACDTALFWPPLPPSLFFVALSLDVSRHLCQCWRSTARRSARLRDGCRAPCPAREKVPFPLLCPLSVPLVRAQRRLTASYW